MNHPAGTNNRDIVKSFLNKLDACWKRVSLVVLSSPYFRITRIDAIVCDNVTSRTTICEN